MRYSHAVGALEFGGFDKRNQRWSPCLRWLRSERQRVSRNHWIGFRQAQPAVVALSSVVEERAPSERLETTGSGFDRLNQRWSGSWVASFSVVEERAPASVSEPLDRVSTGSTSGGRVASSSRWLRSERQRVSRNHWIGFRQAQPAVVRSWVASFSVVEERAPASVSEPLDRVSTGSTSGGPGRGSPRSRWLRSERQRVSRNHWIGFRQAQPAVVRVVGRLVLGG